jgi:RNA polymerase sigma-70 factor (ECF subfamily)
MASRQAEFEALALPHLERLLRFARRLDPSRARDLVQETYLQAWRAFPRLRPESNVRAWLFTILINTARAEGRRAARTPELVPLPDRWEGQSGASAAESVEVLQALDRLPEDQRSALILAVIEGFTSKEISEILRVPIGTVMSRLSRARQALRTALEVEIVRR